MRPAYFAPPTLIISPLLSGGITDHGSYAEVDLKALGYFPFDQRYGRTEDVPAKFRALDGRRVVMKGFMYSGDSAGQPVTVFAGSAALSTSSPAMACRASSTTG